MWQERGSDAGRGYPMQNFNIHVLVLFIGILCDYNSMSKHVLACKMHVKYRQIALKREYKNSAWGIPGLPGNRVPATRQTAE